MNKEFIPYEEALALKELGVKEANAKYGDTSKKLFLKSYDYAQDREDFTPALLYQQAFRWFREEHKLNVQSMRDGGWWLFDICDFSEEEDHSPQQDITHIGAFDDYEKAQLKALKELIKLVKEKK